MGSAGGKPTSAIRKRFVVQVCKVAWKSNTVNVPRTLSVREIPVLEVALKSGELAEDVRRTMGRARFAATYMARGECYWQSPWGDVDAGNLVIEDDAFPMRINGGGVGQEDQ